MAPFLGLIFSCLGRILAHLGPILDRLGHLCWPILSDLGPSRLHLGAIFVSSWPTSAPSCAIVAPSWAHSGHILAPYCPILAYLGPVFVVPRPFPSAAFVLSISVQLPVQLQLVGGGAAAPRFRSGFCPGRRGKRSRVFSSSRLSFFSFFLVVTFSDTKIKSPERTVPRLCR